MRAPRGVPAVTAFEMPLNQDHLSVNWLEYFESDDKEACIEAVRQAFRDKDFEAKRDGRFAVLNVGKAIEKVKLGAEQELRILHWPEADDPSHGGIFDYTSDDLQVALDLQSLVTASDVYHVVP